MYKKPLTVSIVIFCTYGHNINHKNKTRNIEKNIEKLTKEIAF